jgi:hypothetical protein
MQKQQNEIAAETLKIRKGEFEQQQLEFQAEQQAAQQQEQQQLAQIQQVLRQATQGNQIAQQTAQEAGLFEKTRAQMLAMGARPSPEQISLFEQIHQENIDEADYAAIVAKFPKEQRPGASLTMDLMRQGADASTINTLIKDRGIFPETGVARMQRMKDEADLAVVRTSLRKDRGELTTAEWATQKYFPEVAAAGGIVPASVANEIWKIQFKQEHERPQDRVWELTKLLSSKTALSMETLTQEFVVTPEVALARAVEMESAVFGTDPNLTLSPENRAHIAILQRMNRELIIRRQQDERDRKPIEAVKEEMRRAVQGQVFAGVVITPELFEDIWIEALKNE